MIAHIFNGCVIGFTVGYLGGSALLAVFVIAIVCLAAEWRAVACERRARRRIAEEIGATLL